MSNPDTASDPPVTIPLGPGMVRLPVYRIGVTPPTDDRAAPPAPVFSPPAPARTPVDPGIVDAVGEYPPIETVQRLQIVLEALARGEAPYGPLIFPARAPAPEPDARGAKKKKKGPKSTGVQESAPSAPATSIVWPSGPMVGRDILDASEIERIITGILLDPEIMEHPTMPGISRARLREVGRAHAFDPNRFGRFLVPLMVWFARSGVSIRANSTVRSEWSLPRPVVSDDRSVLRRLLAATPPPDGDSVKLAREQGLDSTCP